MARIVLISPFFYPEAISTGKYNTYLAQALAAEGHEVTVIASVPIYPKWKPAPSNAQLPHVEIIRGGSWVRYPRSAVLRRLILELWFAFYANAAIWRLRHKIDTVVFVFPPNLFAVTITRLLPKSVNKICIIHDLQGIMATFSGRGIRKRITSLVQAIERRALRSCERLICLSEAMRTEVARIYGIDGSRLFVHYPFPTLSVDESSDEAVAAMFPATHRHIVYSGALGEKQRPRELLVILERVCAARSDVMCHIFSGGPIFDELSSTKRTVNGGRVVFHDLVPETSLATLYSCSAIQVVPQASGTFAGAFPSKLPNILAAGVPVFAICDSESEVSLILKESKLGRVVNSWGQDRCVHALLDFIDSSGHESRADRRKAAAGYINAKFGIAALLASITPACDVAATTVEPQLLGN